jgi:hypothetical protein
MGLLAATHASAQLIQIKTLPLADGDQWRIFPSAASALGDVSIALADSLLDPFTNPAKGARVARERGAFFSSPTFYTLSDDAGGGDTDRRRRRWGSNFGGVMLALRKSTATGSTRILHGPVPLAAAASGRRPAVSDDDSARSVAAEWFAFASLGHAFEASRFRRRQRAVSGLTTWTGQLLYSGSAAVVQRTFDGCPDRPDEDWSASADRVIGRPR